jgi:uncharacterized protein YndB with AHSA1/START domain
MIITGTVASMTGPVSVTTEIRAPVDQVWAMVADLTRMKEWSPENDGVIWRNGATEAALGASFTGRNRRGHRSWSTAGTIVELERDRALAFRVTAVGMQVARWSYRFESTDTGCRVTETFTDERGAVINILGRLTTGVADRTTHNRAGMEQTLANLKAAAEA